MKACLVAAGLVALALPSAAFADDSDGAYGRLDGDLLIAGSAGAAVALGGPELALDLHALYLSTAGIYVRYAEAFGQDTTPFERSIATGVEVRPLFLGRWAQNLAQGPARLDLFVDSLSFQFGAAWQQPQGMAFHERPAFDIGLSMEFPLLARASGPYLGFLADFRLDDLENRDKRDILEQGTMFVFTFSWHQVAKLGLSDFKDRR